MGEKINTNENIERKIDVKEFCRRFDLAKTNDAKENMIKSIVWRKYCPVLEKKVILQTMLEKTIVTGQNGVSYMDHFLSKVNMVTTTLILYTKLVVTKNENSDTTAFDDYDMLRQRNLINIIWEFIGQDELDELLNINGLVMNNYIEESKTPDACVAKYVNAFASTVGVFANEGLKELVDIVNGVIDSDSNANAVGNAHETKDLKEV